ncbi:hypothetical protein DM02DRAFT_556143, partial [Periconia macrospinosa]
MCLNQLKKSNYSQTKLDMADIPNDRSKASWDPNEEQRTKDANDKDQGSNSATGISDDITALKKKIMELEARQNETASVGPEQNAADPQLSAEFAQYQRMEACLYKHRKEWETNVGPGFVWNVPQYSRSLRSGKDIWKIIDPGLESARVYERPDIFDPTHDCHPDIAKSPNPKDEFDMVIDWGNRRDRLRKNFEWDMDRLFLNEELQRKKDAQAKSTEEKRRRERRMAEATVEGVELAVNTFATPKLNWLEWFDFKRLADIEEKDASLIDVLIGDPIVDDEVGGNQFWYGYSGRRRNQDVSKSGQKPFDPLEPGKSALPERIRIHSDALLRIFSAILGAEGTSLIELEDMTAVFIRPYKALVYREQALRDWCTALETKLLRTSKPQQRISSGSESEDEQDKEEDNKNDLTKSSTALEHLKCLLDFVDSNIVAKRGYLNSAQCRKIFYSDLWLLFRPGMEVIDKDGKQAYKRWWTANNSHKAQQKKASFSVKCVYIDFDGKSIGPVQTTFDFKRFDGEREITSLEIYPIRFHPVRRSEYSDAEWGQLEQYPNEEKHREKLILRGAKFLEVARVKHMYYAGPTLDAKDDVESPVVVDFETAFSMRANQLDYNERLWKPILATLIGDDTTEENDNAIGDSSCSGDCCRDDYVHDDQYVDQKQSSEYINSLLPKANSLDEHPPITIMPRPLKELQTGPQSSVVCPNDELVLMSYRVFGFVLRSRKWAQLDLSYLSEVDPPSENENSEKHEKISEEKKRKENPSLTLNRLVLERGHHSMIVSLIAQHFRDKKSTTGQREEFDLVKGKGKGVAEMFKKPLFQITCGDLGTTATEVEKALEMNFSLANKWDCILLLDEADVFLAERTKEDFKRNGLVAVFLRLMEYYSGILFLTTNRIGDFDEAFTSRIHVSLYYPELNEEKTVKVFKLNMDMIEERFRTKNRVVHIDRMEIGSFAGKYFAEHPHARWNGRQIRNACQTALALAEFEAQEGSLKDTENSDTVVSLRVEHFEIVRNAYLEFNKYMHDLYGSTSARRAKESRLRAIWIDEHDRVVKTQNMGGTGLEKKNAFMLASQGQIGRPSGHSPQQSFHMNPQHQQQGYYQGPMQNQPFN